MYVCLFCFSMESSHFWPSFLHVVLYKTLFFGFWFRPPNSQNLLPKIWQKISITRLVWHIDRRCLGLLGGFWGCTKCCGTDPCCHGNEIWPRRGDLNAYRHVFSISLLVVLASWLIISIQLQSTLQRLIMFVCLLVSLSIFLQYTVY